MPPEKAKKTRHTSLMKSYSFLSLLLCYLIMGYFQFVDYPKFQKQWTEATIRWDVSGYYMYLPAAFIYKDLKRCEFRDDLIKNYKPTPDLLCWGSIF